MSRKTLALSVLALAALLLPAWAADPDALWKIISGSCGPCVDHGPGYVVMKDHHGVAQYLVLPSDRITGIEDPAILAQGAPNYFAAAWEARHWMQEKLPQPMNRDRISLALNSAHGRSQNQLHIHVDCLDAGVHDALTPQISAIGPDWSPLPQGLRHHPYWARRVAGDDLTAVNPILLLADGVPGARDHMDRQTLVVVGAEPSGFILLTDQADLAGLDRANGEEVQDHDCRP